MFISLRYSILVIDGWVALQWLLLYKLYFLLVVNLKKKKILTAQYKETKTIFVGSLCLGQNSLFLALALNASL